MIDVKIERFKNVRDVDFSFDSLNLLIGGNNAGKSSVLQAIQFGVSAAQTTSMQNAYWNNDRLSTSIGQSELVYSPLKDVFSLAYNSRLREAEAESIRITYKYDGLECRVSVRKGRNKNILIELVGQGLGERLQSISNPFATFVTGLAGIPAEEAYEPNIVVKKAAARGDSNSVFRNILLQLKQIPDRWTKFTAQLGTIFPEHAIDVSFNGDADEIIQCMVTKNGMELPIDSSGTGVLQAIQIFSYVNLFNPQVLILDEPDSHLHPNNQKALVNELKRVAENGVCVLMASHSKHIVESTIDDAKTFWMRNGDKIPEVDSYEVKALVEIGALNVGESLSQAACVILTEDKNKDIIELILESSGFDLDNCEILAYAGCTNTHTAVALINYMRRTNADATYIIHKDRDFNDQANLNEFVEKFRLMSIKVFIPAGNDLEAYLVNTEHLSQSCGITAETAAEIYESAFSARKDELVAKYVNTRIENLRRLGVQPNAGDISAECLSKMTTAPTEIIHGKILLRGIRDALRSKGIADKIFSTSSKISIDSLRNLAGL